jgi:peptidoglycan/xylan/chitin deacetylase (PgdA/CDA1 family)
MSGPVTVAVPILNYHTISDDPGPAIAPFAVRPAEFARHLDLLVAGGHTVLTVSAYVELLERGTALPPRVAVITFDDGFEDNLTVAAPMLAARGLPATVYVATGHLPGCPGGPAGRPLGPMLPFDYLPELEAAGVEVGAHSHSHPQLDTLPRRDARDEIRHGRDLLEGGLGHPVASFAYPHGYASAWLQREVGRAGFRSACGVRDALSHPRDNRWLLARLVMRPTTTCEQLDAWLHGAGARMATPAEQLRTKAWRAARRVRALAEAPPVAVSVDAGCRP